MPVNKVQITTQNKEFWVEDIEYIDNHLMISSAFEVEIENIKIVMPNGKEINFKKVG